MAVRKSGKLYYSGFLKPISRRASYVHSGLKTSSVIRLTRLAAVSDSIFFGDIGEISAARLGDLKKRLAQWIESS